MFLKLMWFNVKFDMKFVLLYQNGYLPDIKLNYKVFNVFINK